MFYNFIMNQKMHGIICVVVLSVLCKFVSGFVMVPEIPASEKSIQGNVNYQSLYTILQSIEGRIENIEHTINTQYTSLTEGKIHHYGRKIENIEKDIVRFEAHVRIEMDKLLENISNKNFKEDITKDRILRKIDGIYERISHKLTNIEGQSDVSNIKSQNAHEIILSKLDKIEENLSIRDRDLEAEIADTAAAIDDFKGACINMEENIANLTRDSFKTVIKSLDKSSKKYYNQAANMFEDGAKNISSDFLMLQKAVENSVNSSNEVISKISKAKVDIEESMNEYANKITDMFSDLWMKTDMINQTIKHLAVITNITRNEQQNGLRALIVEVGRKTTKHVENESSGDNHKALELLKKIDSNFENVIMTQNLFLESCHRVQMDESQLESQISIVLDKLIDTFENKTALGPKDIKHLEHLIRNHDTNIRKGIYQITSHLLNLIQKNSDNKDEIVDYVKSQLLHLNAFNVVVQDTLNVKKSEERNDILQILHQAINKSHTSTDQLNFTKLEKILEYAQNISAVLTSIEKNIKKPQLNIAFTNYTTEISKIMGKKLNKYLQNILETNENSTLQKLNESAITKLLLEIFNANFDNESFIKKLIVRDNSSIVSPYTFNTVIKSSSVQNNSDIDNIESTDLNNAIDNQDGNTTKSYNIFSKLNIIDYTTDLTVNNSDINVLDANTENGDLKNSTAPNLLQEAHTHENENTRFDLSLLSYTIKDEESNTQETVEQLFLTTEDTVSLQMED